MTGSPALPEEFVPMAKCVLCNKELKGYVYELSNGKGICEKCGDELASKPDKCPVCGTIAKEVTDLAIQLTYRSKYEHTDNALVHVCSQCHAMYLDGFQYRLFELARDD